jgi:hypothetical protein
MIHKAKMTAEMDGQFIVSMFGMRINTLWKVHRWFPLMRAMRRMLKELQSHPESGYLGHEKFGFMTVIYWRSFDQIEAYARSKDYTHVSAWANFMKVHQYSSSDVGIWHELYIIQPGNYEAIYASMPAIGLGKIGQLQPATGSRDTSRGRLKPVEA